MAQVDIWLPMFQVNKLVHDYQYKPHNFWKSTGLNYTGRSLKSHIPGYISTNGPGINIITIDHSKSYTPNQLQKLKLTVKTSSFAHLIMKCTYLEII